MNSPLSTIWSRIPNKTQTDSGGGSNGDRPSPSPSSSVVPLPLSSGELHRFGPAFFQQYDPSSSPRSSVSSGNLAPTPPKSHSPANSHLSLITHQLEAEASDHSASSVGPSPLATVSYAGTSPTPGGLTASQPFSPLSNHPALSTGLGPAPASPSSSRQQPLSTQAALEEIFQGNPRPHYRSSLSFSANGAHNSSSRDAQLQQQPLSPSTDSVPRSYFSPPQPAPAPSQVHHLHQGSHDSSGAPGDTVHSLLQGRHRSLSSAASVPSHFSAPQRPVVGGLPGSMGVLSPQAGSEMASTTPIKIGGHSGNGDGSEGAYRPGGNGHGQPVRMPSFSSQYGTNSAGGHQQQQQYQAGRSSYGAGGGMGGSDAWGSSLPSGGGSAWEERGRDSRARMRHESEERNYWVEREPSASSTGTGIGISNMSPFARDTRVLPDFNVGPESTYRSRRDYSLGAVGSGRKRGDTIWSGAAPGRLNEDDEDGDFAAPTRSGATSRRHSIVGFAPSRSQGFNFNDTSSNSLKPDAPVGGNGRYPGFGAFGSKPGSSAINDDELAADLNSLHLNLEAHAAATSKSTSAELHAGSMPIYPTGSNAFYRSTSRSRDRYDDRFNDRYDDSQSRSPPPLGARGAPGQPSPSGGQPLPLPRSSSVSRGGYGGPPSPPRAGGFRFDLGQEQQQAQRDYRGPPSAGGPFSPPGISSAAPSFGGYSGNAPASPGASAMGLTSMYFSGGGPGTGGAPYALTQPVQAGQDLRELGRGIPLHAVPANAPLFIVEFKAGRKDLFFVEDPNIQLRQGDLVIVEADRGKDIGKFYKPCSLEEVQAFQQRLVELALGQLANPSAGGQTPTPAMISRMTKEFNPKKIYGKAQPGDTQLLLSKAQDEAKALALVRSKVAQRNLAMEIADCEFQWDRRKLTFYYTAHQRVDFRDLVRELFRLYKTRIWMCCVSGSQDDRLTLPQ